MNDETSLWLSLPVPAVLIDPDDRISDLNPPGEIFLNLSARAAIGQPAFDAFVIDAAVDEQAARVRRDRAPVSLNDVAVGTGQAAPVACNVQIAPLTGQDGALLMLITPRVMADRLQRALRGHDNLSFGQIGGKVGHWPVGNAGP